MGKPEYEAASLEILRTLIRFEDQNTVDWLVGKVSRLLLQVSYCITHDTTIRKAT